MVSSTISFTYYLRRKMIKKSDVTILIPTMDIERNGYALNECLTSLRESGFPMKNISVVFNGLKEKDWIPVGDIIFNDIDVSGLMTQGQCAATNYAANEVNTPWIMVSNDDMVYKPQFWEDFLNGVQELENRRNLYKIEYCVSPQLIEPNDGAPTFIKYFCGGVGGDWDKKKWLNYNHKGQGIRPGFNLPFLIKKEVWDLVGGYDVNYDPWGSNSDSDLEYKLKLAGIKMYQNTNCPVYHFSQTSNTFHPDNRKHWQKNWDYFIEKWGFERTDKGIWEATFEIPYDKLKYRPSWAKLPQEESVKS